MRAIERSRAHIWRRLLFLLGLVAGGPTFAATEWQIGLNFQAGYNSQVLNAQLLDDMGTVSGTGALTTSVSPSLMIGTDTGRISEHFRYQLLLDGILLLDHATPSYSYANTLSSDTRIHLTARTQLFINVLASQGRINSFMQNLDVTTRDVQAVALFASEFVNASGTERIQWEPTARLRLGQSLALRAFIPYGDVTSMVRGGETSRISATTSFQSYNVDGTLTLDYSWTRAQLGSMIMMSWFRPQTGANPQGDDSDRSVINAQAVLRGGVDLSPRWHASASIGAVISTLANRFLEGTRIIGEGENAREVRSTMVGPSGSLDLRYLFPRVDWTLSLNYMHTVAGEVFFGLLTQNDAVTLRLFVPIGERVHLAGSGGYRYAQIGGTGPDTLSFSQDLHVAQANARLSVMVTEGFSIYTGYEFIHQVVVGEPPPGQVPLAGFNRHLAFLGMGLVYPTR